jgi:hypothetical protein
MPFPKLKKRKNVMKLFDGNKRKQARNAIKWCKTLAMQSEAYGWDSCKLPYQQKDDLIPKVPFPYPLKVFS